MNKSELQFFRLEAYQHLTNELLPFWTARMKDKKNGGYLIHFDKNGNDTREDEKSLIAQTRCLNTVASVYRTGLQNIESPDWGGWEDDLFGYGKIPGSIRFRNQDMNILKEKAV